ncbi:MAG: carboxymuconolactone decarboxylase family protein [Rubrivivax sp.]|nr:carboxymuconolactone decarboxylase family protein [Rubrivivax sp.]
MARIDYVDEQSPAVDAELLRAVKARRGGQLLNLDRQLLHSAPLAQGWNVCMGAIRSQTRLDGALRELVILRVAVLNRAPYEFAQHAPVARAEGLSQAQIDAVQAWQASPLFDARARDVLAYADAMTLQVQVPQPLFDAVRAHFDARELVELTATVAAYNMVSRFLEALQIDIET